MSPRPRLLADWRADRQRAGRSVQRQPARPLPERELVLVVG